MDENEEINEIFSDRSDDSSSQKINFLDFSESVFIKKKIIHPSNSPTILKPSKTTLNFDDFFIAKMLKKSLKPYKEIIPLKTELKYLFMAFQRNTQNVYLLFFEEKRNEMMHYQKMKKILEYLKINFVLNESMCICALCKETYEFTVKFKDKNYFLSQIKVGDYNLTHEIMEKRENQKRYEKNEIHKILYDLTTQIFSMNLNEQSLQVLNTDHIIYNKLGNIYFLLEILLEEEIGEDLEGVDLLNNCQISCITLNNESNLTEANQTLQDFRKECDIIRS
jgi:hypothetical protein